MITTLDPQMKDYIGSSGSIEMAIASDKEVKITSLKEGFQKVFGHVSARGLGAPGSLSTAAQPVGFVHGRKAAGERIRSLRQSRLVPHEVPIIAVEGLVFDSGDDRMYSADVILLEDSVRDLRLEVISQSVPVPPQVVTLLKRHTPADYGLREAGFAITVGQAAAEALATTPTEWQEYISGLSRRETIRLAAASLAYTYKTHLASAAAINISPAQ